MEITRTDIINKLIERYNLESYLEIGVRDASKNFDKIIAPIKEGVDPAPITPVTYKMTSDKFFAHVCLNKHDLIFIDGLHTQEQAWLDIASSFMALSFDGFIVIHDCNPPTEYHARSYEEYLKTGGEWNGDVFRAFIKARIMFPFTNCFVVDADFGCGIITKRKLNKWYDKSGHYNYRMCWELFDSNRKELLNLISYDEFLNLLI